MILTLNPEHERIVTEALRAGHYRSAEEVIARALEVLREQEQGVLQRPVKRDPKRAAAR
jgi:Arc/MetJ-type ribon-helix-helix transcriptional regulator